MDPFDDDAPLGYLLYRVHNALRAEVTATVLEPLGLAFPQYICMRILSRFPGRSNAELARDTNVSPQAMNMVLRGLVRNADWSRVRPPCRRDGPCRLSSAREGRELLGARMPVCGRPSAG